MSKEKITDYPIEERDDVYDDILKSIKPLSEKYSESIIRWALARLLKEKKEVAKALKDKADAEQRLKELGVS